MSIVQPAYNLSNLKMDLPKGRKPLVSAMEITTAVAPKFLGKVMAEHIAQESLLSWIMASGNEEIIAADQVSWSEELDSSLVTQITGGFVNRSGDNFTIGSGAVTANTYDIDSSRPKELKFYVAKGQEFVVVDNTGKRNNGVVTSVSSDGKSITATRTDDDSWNVGTSNLDIIWLGYNLDHCECPPCVGSVNYSPTYENSMYKDGVCKEYCDETQIANGGWEAFPERNINNGLFYEDEALTEKIKELNMRSENAILWARRMSKTKADSLGKPQGLMGVFQQLEDKATKIEGTIDDLDDLIRLGNYLKKKGVMTAYLDATDTQYAKLMKIHRDNANITFNPFENNTNDLIYLGYKGVKLYNGVTILFRELPGLSNVGMENISKKYNFLVIPVGKVDVMLNGEKKKMGHVNLVWFGKEGNVFKLKRDSNENDGNCGVVKINYINKFTVIVLRADKFILGVNV